MQNNAKKPPNMHYSLNL